MINRLLSTAFVVFAVSPIAVLSVGGYIVAGKARQEPALWALAGLMAVALAAFVAAGIAEIWRVRK